jgi:hypothetical protein
MERPVSSKDSSAWCERAAKLRALGQSYNAIGNAIGVNASTIARALNPGRRQGKNKGADHPAYAAKVAVKLKREPRKPIPPETILEAARLFAKNMIGRDELMRRITPPELRA